ncbi:ectonucleotide pyrophosphatase/phosphodiesterase [Caulobacter sp.]|uniref:alkaline phosphatase family protein n=1 Tax=Caulobacter sp. TaxID=78 RepID=UPI003BA9E3AF
MIRSFRLAIAGLALLAAATAPMAATAGPLKRLLPTLPASPLATKPPKSRLTILVSIDGFRADYLDRGDTPTLSALAADGVRSEMRPSFPSLTYPNHYALITGKRPDRNGIVNNVMNDTTIPSALFRMSNKDAVNDGRWWSQATPLWVSLEKKGKPAAAMFWPGSQAEIKGVRPSRWVEYDHEMPPEARVDMLLSWLDDPKGPELRFSTLYFDDVDTDGHHYGPESAEVRAAAARVDKALARLVEGLKARGRYDTTDLVIVADHGMAPVPASQRWMLDDILDVSKVRVISTGAVLGLTPRRGHEKEIENILIAPPWRLKLPHPRITLPWQDKATEVETAGFKPPPHMTCWRKGEMPRRFHYGTNARIPAIVCLSEPGWQVSTRAAKPSKWDRMDGGAHGYDPADPTMRAVFVARGPSFKSGVSLPAFDNVDVYPLLARISGVRAERGDGRLKTVKDALR